MKHTTATIASYAFSLHFRRPAYQRAFQHASAHREYSQVTPMPRELSRRDGVGRRFSVRHMMRFLRDDDFPLPRELTSPSRRYFPDELMSGLMREFKRFICGGIGAYSVDTLLSVLYRKSS